MITSTNPMVYTNPVVYTDFPDPDIIRVGDVYYMATTTMHFTPGCDILRSYDLVHWEFIAHALNIVADTPEERLNVKVPTPTVEACGRRHCVTIEAPGMCCLLPTIRIPAIC